MAAERLVLRWVLTVLVAVTLVAGCADVPTSGLLQHTGLPTGTGGDQQGTDCCGYIMTGPGPGSSPSQIVQGFLLASADFGNHHQIARQYLTTSASRSWQPGPGPAVTVVASPPTVTPAPPPFGSRNTAVVEISAQQLGNVSSSGQYIQAETGQQELNQEFTLQKVDHQWRIATLPKKSSAGVDQPSHELLLTKDLFQLAFQARNLYYLDPAGKNLVPDPVFVPVDSGDPVADLVRALLISPQGWLAGAVLSAFPPAATLRHAVEILPGSKTAVVDLSLPKSATSTMSLAGMASQLVWTLTSSSYGAASIQAVKLEVNGKVWTPPGASSAVISPRSYPQPALQTPRPEKLYFLGSNGAARVLGTQGGSSTAVPGQAGTGQVSLTSIAVSRDQRYLAGIGGTPGAPTLYTSSLSAAAKPHASSATRALHIRMSGVSIASVSWDRDDNLWVAGSSGGKPRVWVLGAASGTPLSVGLPPHIRSVTALRVAPDGVRVAMLTSVNTSNGPQKEVLLAAIERANAQVMLSSAGPVGADLTRPSALSWYDADHLLVVNQAPLGPQLEEVPVDGDRSSYQGIEPDMASIAAAGPHNGLFVGLQTGHLARSVGLGELWNQFAEGSAVTYPG
ncbi:MAG TPA: LpqB family beta-propeller domain-containing protein [Streptosporangiaceae bacterium]|nr:LpqB family beta-propeller domain-containing protein [Streptosporangiaceae bacterium]